MFKNAKIYRFDPAWAMTRDQLSEQLSRRMFQYCGSQDMHTSGFVPPAHGDMVHNVGGQWLIALKTQSRVLPSSVVRAESAKRAEELEQQQGFKPGRKQMREIKDAVLQELTPRAFTKSKTVFVWINKADGLLVIDTSSAKVAESVIENLYKALEDFPLRLLNPSKPLASSMTVWLSLGVAPVGFTIDQDCELHAVTDESSAVRYVRHSLDGEDIRDHIAAGKQVTKLALTFDDKVSFILTEKLELKRVTLLDVDSGEATTREEQFDADFLLMTDQLSRLIPALIDALGGEGKSYDENDLVEQAKEPIEKDDLYEKAVQVVLSNNRASISLVQRHLAIGYNRAANLLLQMEKAGVVSVENSTGARKVLKMAA